ncbi:MAG TPA: hypothetical protein VHW00_23630 [Thermoanaerobaculia bacterium]|nr:hypothetical protein [Thermoanaerobaculia bacterium]
MRRKRHERGEGQFGCLVGLALLLVAALIAYKMIPVKVKAAEMRDVVYDESKSAGQHNDKQITKAIVTKAEQLGFAVKESDVRIDRTPANIRVEVNYVVPVDFPGYTYQWEFHHKAENPIF